MTTRPCRFFVGIKNPYTDFGFKYEASQKEYWDYTSTLETAELKGEKKGKIELARKMKTDGLSNELIAKYTGLSDDEIEEV